MKLNYLNFKPTKEQRNYLEQEFSRLKHEITNDDSFIINVKYKNEKYSAKATIFKDNFIVQGEMKARKIDILAPSLIIELKSKMAWQQSQKNQKYSASA